MSFAFETPKSGVAALFALNVARQLPTLVTDRLILRAPRVTDFETYAEILCSARAVHIGGPKSREAAWDDFARMTSPDLLHQPCLWTIGHAGGIAGFIVLNMAGGEAELSVLLTATAEGRGIAHDAARAALDHAFDTLGCATLISRIAPENARGNRLARRLGAVRVGTETGARLWCHTQAEAAA